MTIPRRLRNCIDGDWSEPAGPRLDVENPATGGVIATMPVSGAAEVDAAVRAAEAAFPAWAATPADRRVAPLFRLAALMRERREALVRTLVEENGKSLPDRKSVV